MAWETRGNRAYYYRKVRHGDKVVSEYVGHGDLVEALADLEQAERDQAQLEREAWRQEREAIERIDEQLARAGCLAQALAEMALLAAGYHLYQRTWRKWTMAHSDVTTTKKERPLTGQEIRQIVDAVNKKNPKKADVAKFRDILASGETWRIAGDVCQFTCNLIINNSSGDNHAVRLSLDKGLSQVKAGLGYSEASPLEQILIDQVGLTWLRHNWLEYQYQQLQGQSITLTKGMYWEKKLSQSQRRFLRAVESLAKIRKMAKRTPEILYQINVAAQQVNQIG